MIDSENKIKELEDTIAFLKSKLASEIRKNVGDKILLDHYIKLFSATTANYLLDPSPEKLETQGNKAGSSNTHLVLIKNIIAVKSDGRMKKIFLTEAQKPIEGGTAENPLIMNTDASNWQNALFSIQRNQQFLFRIHNSFAINIFHYTFGEDKKFKLNEELKPSSDSIIHLISTDSKFEPLSYHKRLLEIKQLFDAQVGFVMNLEKLDEISRSIKTGFVPKES